MDKRDYALALSARTKRAGLTAAEIARRAGISDHTVTRAITGDGSPSLETAQKIARAMGYASIGDFLLAAGLTSFRPVKMYVGGDEITIYVPEEYASKDITRKSA